MRWCLFVGGCATGLLLTDPAAPSIRVTEDVDAIVEATTLRQYYHLSESLRECGFVEDMTPDAPICRWRTKGVVLDVMPTNPEILGFGNKWFGPAAAAAVHIELYSGRLIRMVTAPYFLATKFEAFDGRGNRDYLISHDMEDIIVLIDGRAEIVFKKMADLGHPQSFHSLGFFPPRTALHTASPSSPPLP